MRFLTLLVFLLTACTGYMASGQEKTGPLQENVVIRKRAQQSDPVQHRPTALTLPFFEDFTDYDPYPSADRWADKEVYINNTMGRHMISRGVATFDALNAQGAIYYDSVGAYTTIYADTLTSLGFDLSTHQVADSVYLSFFCERGGYGFFPKPGDSLMLFFLTANGVWQKVWAQEGDTAQLGFVQYMIPLNSPEYFYDNFKMRWINKATLGISNSHWHLDYIRMDANRTYNDTAVRDVAFTADPLPILSDFSSMPFRHFRVNPPNYLSANLTAYMKNNGGSSVNLNVGYTAKEQSGGSLLGSGAATASINPYESRTLTFPMYNAAAFNPSDPNGKVVYEEQFYSSSTYPNEPVVNDTIHCRQVFDNYFAYDDGTAEQSYFLNLLPNAPGVTAVEYALAQTDTIRGVAIRFARTQPAQTGKDFSLAVYKDIAVNGGADQQVYKEDYFYPSYVDTINAFSVYAFAQPVVLNSGAFYIGIIQPAGGISDSLQIALDANRETGNHRYYRVSLTWESSQLPGALMVRPIVGAAIPLGARDVTRNKASFTVYPNPATATLNWNVTSAVPATSRYLVTDATGRVCGGGSFTAQGSADIHALPPGMYFFRVQDDTGRISGVRKFIKM